MGNGREIAKYDMLNRKFALLICASILSQAATMRLGVMKG
jgi:hypothetical protein